MHWRFTFLLIVSEFLLNRVSIFFFLSVQGNVLDLSFGVILHTAQIL